MTDTAPALPLDVLEEVAERVASGDPDALDGLDGLAPTVGRAAAWVDGAVWMARHVHGSAGAAQVSWERERLHRQVQASVPLPDRVVHLMGDGEPWTPSALAEALDSDKWQVSRALARLRSAGTVVSAPADPADRRLRRYQLARPAPPSGA